MLTELDVLRILEAPFATEDALREAELAVRARASSNQVALMERVGKVRGAAHGRRCVRAYAREQAQGAGVLS
jgi:hypothetical protein